MKLFVCNCVGMLHYEGGWPREIDVGDDEQKQRYCKKLEKEEGYTQTILSLCEGMETSILQNSAIDIYEDYFTDVDQVSCLLLRPPPPHTHTHTHTHTNTLRVFSFYSCCSCYYGLTRKVTM